MISFLKQQLPENVYISFKKETKKDIKINGFPSFQSFSSAKLTSY